MRIRVAEPAESARVRLGKVHAKCTYIHDTHIRKIYIYIYIYIYIFKYIYTHIYGPTHAHDVIGVLPAALLLRPLLSYRFVFSFSWCDCCLFLLRGYTECSASPVWSIFANYYKEKAALCAIITIPHALIKYKNAVLNTLNWLKSLLDFFIHVRYSSDKFFIIWLHFTCKILQLDNNRKISQIAWPRIQK